MSHIPVMTAQLLRFLSPRDGGVYIDSSFGGGGHARAILESADCSVLAIDRDPAAIARGEQLRKDFPKRLTLAQGRFSDLARLIAQHHIERVDGISFDAGVSSYQLEDAARGFSYRMEGALDMRMDNRHNNHSRAAADWVNRLSEHDLAHIIGVYGEEKIAKPIAHAIVKARHEKPITSTTQLAEIILSVRPRRASDRIHPATRTFQALRILVNDELTELACGMHAAEHALTQGGRLVIISFHSLEDRLVKRFFRSRAPRSGAGVSRHQPLPAPPPPPSFEPLRPSPARPHADEIAANPSARSAKMRGGQRTAHPPHPVLKVESQLGKSIFGKSIS